MYSYKEFEGSDRQYKYVSSPHTLPTPRNGHKKQFLGSLSGACNAASFSLLELRARNSSSPHDIVLLSPFSCLCHCHRSPPHPRPPTSPRKVQPPPASAAFSPRPSQAATWSTRGSGTTNTPATAFPDHPRHIPSIVPAAQEEYPSWSSTLRPPPTCHPAASGFLPPPPPAAACQLQRNNQPFHWVLPRSNNCLAYWLDHVRGPPLCAGSKDSRLRARKTASSLPFCPLRLFLPQSDHRCTDARKKCRLPAPFMSPPLRPGIRDLERNVKWLLCFPAVRHSRRQLPFPLGSSWRIDYWVSWEVRLLSGKLELVGRLLIKSKSETLFGDCRKGRD